MMQKHITNINLLYANEVTHIDLQHLRSRTPVWMMKNHIINIIMDSYGGQIWNR